MVKKNSQYKKFGGKRFNLHCRSKTKTSADNIKKEMKTHGYLVRVTKTKEYYPYQIWIRRKK